MLCVNGDCMNTIGGYTCDCFDGYDGPHCEVDINECLEADCANGATCIDRVAGYSCECRDGSSGDSCEECDISDCQTCHFATDPIQCAQCSDGYSLNDDGLCGMDGYIKSVHIHTCSYFTHERLALCIYILSMPCG